MDDYISVIKKNFNCLINDIIIYYIWVPRNVIMLKTILSNNN